MKARDQHTTNDGVTHKRCNIDSARLWRPGL
jgi:hypothetical protein